MPSLITVLAVLASVPAVMVLLVVSILLRAVQCVSSALFVVFSWCAMSSGEISLFLERVITAGYEKLVAACGGGK